MAKQKTAKKKGPKGKKARAKAKLERQWGETAIVDNEKPRRVGKSRLIARSANNDREPSVRWAQDEGRGKTQVAVEPAASQGTSVKGVLKNNSPSSKIGNRHRKDETFRSDSEAESDDDETPALQGFLSAIRKKIKQSGSSKRQGDGSQPSSNFDAQHRGDDSSDTEMESSDDSDNSDGDFDEKDDNGIDEVDDDDDDSVVDDIARRRKVDLYYQHFSQSPLQPDELKSTTQTSSNKLIINDQLEFEVITRIARRELDSSKFGPDTGLDDLRKLAATAFEGNRKALQNRWKRLHKGILKDSQFPVYSFLSRYMDLLITTDSRKHRKEMHQIYLLHVLNHVLTSRSRVQRHNRQLKELAAEAQDSDDDEKAAEQMDTDNSRFRDQGFTRPTVLVLLPTRGTCHKFVHDLLEMTGSDNTGPHVERFDVEFGKPVYDEDDDGKDSSFEADEERRRKAVLEKKGKDWNDLFGDDVNNDDDFKVGIALTPKAAKSQKKESSNSSNIQPKLYTDFYKSDIIVASPLGLKVLTAADDEGKGGDSDFLSSIEICLVEYADVLLMQNWDHVNDIFNLLNKEPQRNNDTDFSRVRNPILEGQGAYWRQLILSTDIMDPFLHNAFKRFGKSISGSVKARRKIQPEEAALASVHLPMKQVFQRVPVPSFDQQTDGRVNYFVKHILPQIQRHKQKHTMIYIPSYFDFVALRNIFLKREISFVSVHEYSRVTETSRGRARFAQGRKPIMLYTGRCNYFHRHAIKGIRHLIFLGLPEHPQFYADQVNLINTGTPMNLTDDVDTATSVSSCLALFTRFEGFALERVVGTANCSRMLQSDKATFMFHS